MNGVAKIAILLAICLSALAGLWFNLKTTQLNVVWTDTGKITSIQQKADSYSIYWQFQVVTAHHGNQTVVSDCNNELVGNAVYVSLLGSGKIAQTDSAGNIVCLS